MHLRILSRRPSSRPLTRQDIRKTSRATIAALAVYGVDSCLFGSAACSMYGVRRIPNVGQLRCAPGIFTNLQTTGYRCYRLD